MIFFIIGLLLTLPFFFRPSNTTATCAMIGAIIMLITYGHILVDRHKMKRQNERNEIMRRLFTVLTLIFLTAGIAQASPFMVSDPSNDGVGGVFEIWQGLVGLTTDSQIMSQCTVFDSQNNQADGSIRYDLANIPAGTFNWYIRYGKSWGYYGPNNTEVTGSMVYSSFVPFDFTKRSSVSNGPKNFRIVK